MATPPEYRQADDEREGLTLRDYLGVMWRRKWIIILVTVVATVAAFGFSYRQAKVYEAQADLIYEQQLDVANPLTGQSYTDPTQRTTELTSVNAIIQSPTITNRVTTALEEQGLPTSGLRGPRGGGSGRDRHRHAVVQRRLGDRHERRRGVLRGRGADLRRPVRGLAQGAHARARSPAAIDAVEQEAAQLHGRREGVVGLPHPGSSGCSDLQILRETATGNFRVLVPATVPETPIAPKPLRSAILGFGVGLFAGIGLAFLLEQFDTRVRRPDDVAAMLRQPVLARVPRLSREQTKSPKLVTLEHPADPVAESFRLMRTNLAFMDVDGTVKSLLVTSSLQGEGKSVTVANLAVTLALAGKKVIVVDADLRRPRQHRLFGLENEAGASNVAVGEADLVDTLQSVAGDLARTATARRPTSPAGRPPPERSRRLWVLTSGPIPPNPGEIVASQRFSQMLGRLRDECDIAPRRLAGHARRRRHGGAGLGGGRADLPGGHGEGAAPRAAGGRRPALPFAVCHDGHRRALGRRQLARQVLLHLALPVLSRRLARHASRCVSRRHWRRTVKLAGRGR